MNDAHANRGHVGLSGTSPIEVVAQGFTPMDGDFTFSSITFPATRGAVAYQGDAAFCAARTYLEGVYYPIPFTSITPATGVAFAWRE